MMSVPRLPPGADGDRLLRRLADLGRIGVQASGGITRAGFSHQDRRAQRYLAREATQAGLHAWVDPAGNLLFRRGDADERRPRLLLGSHLDTVVNGGRFDGAYGVVAALEVLQVLAETAGGEPPRCEPVAVAFANDEGALFPQVFWGSKALAGCVDDFSAEPTDRFGRPLRQALRRAGGDLDTLATAAWSPESISAFLELHIEQGPVLDDSGVPIGVVDSIAGRLLFDVIVSGRAGHAGTTPMTGRSDALVIASRIVLAADQIARSGRCRVATTGRLTVRPDTANVIPSEAFATVEFRDGSRSKLAAAKRDFLDAVRQIAHEGGAGVGIDADRSFLTEPVVTDPRLRRAIATAAGELGLAFMELPSGACHDAQIVAAIAPVGMIFVPCRSGLSHVPEEHVDPQNLIAGTEVLLRVARSLQDEGPLPYRTSTVLVH
jgi:beta-ureidopropionase / N-carbamoyl-L-amino-acid hydrolase